jgi:hypothetical protein
MRVVYAITIVLLIMAGLLSLGFVVVFTAFNLGIRQDGYELPNYTLYKILTVVLSLILLGTITYGIVYCVRQLKRLK